MGTTNNTACVQVVDSTRILINLDFHEVVSIWSNGTIEFHNGFSPDEAAQVFWQAIEQHNPYKDEVTELRNRLAQYEPITKEEPDDPIAAYDRAMRILGRP